MPRTTYVWREGVGCVEKSCVDRQSVHFVISDTMAAAPHPCTGEMMDSKSRFRTVTREHGCVEVGNEKFPERRESYDRRDMQRDIAHALRNPDRRPTVTMDQFARREGWA